MVGENLFPIVPLLSLPLVLAHACPLKITKQQKFGSIYSWKPHNYMKYEGFEKYVNSDKSKIPKT